MRICNPPISPARRTAGGPFSKGGIEETKVLIPDQSLSVILTAVLCKGADCRFRAKGHSMSPFIKDGDVLTISPLSSSLKIGNVVAFVHPKTERLTIHRVVGKKGDSYLMKGDNTLETDGFVPEKNILGLVTRIERNGRRIFLGSGYGKIHIATSQEEGEMVKANMKTLIFNPLSLAFIFFHKTYVKIQDLASKFLMCLKNTVIHKISMRLNCDAFVRFLKNVKIQDLTPIICQRGCRSGR